MDNSSWVMILGSCGRSPLELFVKSQSGYPEQATKFPLLPNFERSGLPHFGQSSPISFCVILVLSRSLFSFTSFMN